jgi:zinc protease
VEVNGTVYDAVTVFWASGPERLALDMMRRIAANLAEPPLHRLETERQILLTEAAGGGNGPVQTSMLLRFGPTGHGLVGYDEYGLHRLDASAVAAWTRRYFTRGNAALWMTRKPPRDLRLPLPDGKPMPARDVDPITELVLPALYDRGPEGSVTLSLVAQRSADLENAVAIAANRLRERLRHTSGVSYQVAYDYEWITADLGHVTICADTLERNAEAVRDGLHETLHELARSGPDPDELRREVERFGVELADPDEATSSLSVRAWHRVLGGPEFTEASVLADHESVTSESAAFALREALETELLIVPEGTRRGRERLNPYPVQSRRRVDGRRYRLAGLRAPRDVSLLAGDEGLTSIIGDEQVTVLFSECEALLTWADGSRGLWGRDGFYINVEPDDWRRGRELVRFIDARATDAVPRVSMDRDLLERTEIVERSVEGRVERGFWTRRELDSLPHHLERGEEIVRVTRATKGWRAGVLVVTDRRLLFLYQDDVVDDVSLWEIAGVSQRPGSFWSGPSLVLRIGDEDRSFTDVHDESLDDLAATLAPQQDAE